MAPPTSSRAAALQPRSTAGAPFRALVVLLVGLSVVAQGFFVLPPPPSHRRSASPLWTRVRTPLLSSSSSSSSSSPLPTARPKPDQGRVPTTTQHAQHQEQHGAVLDSHWLQGDVVAQLRSGEIPAFTWPEATGADVATGAGITPLGPVDRAALQEARAQLRSVPAVWAALAAACPNNPMLVDPAHAVPGRKGGLVLSFGQVDTLVQQAAAGLHALGLRKGDHVAVFGENSARWLLMEQGCARQGLPTAVRGMAAPVDELQFIYDHSDAKAVVLQVRTHF